MSGLLGITEEVGISNTADLVQQTATFLWLHRGDEFKDLLKKFTGYRVANEIFSRITKRSEIDDLRNQCIMDIVNFIKKHPNASEAQLEAEIIRCIVEFKKKLESM